MTQSADAGRAPTGEQTPSDFATTLAELEALVRRLESGDMSLESSLSSFERGVALVRDARSRLEQAELRVRELVERGDGSLAEAPHGEASPVDESDP